MTYLLAICVVGISLAAMPVLAQEPGRELEFDGDRLGGMLGHLGGGAAGLGRTGDAAHSVQVRCGVAF